MKDVYLWFYVIHACECLCLLEMYRRPAVVTTECEYYFCCVRKYIIIPMFSCRLLVIAGPVATILRQKKNNWQLDLTLEGELIVETLEKSSYASVPS